MIDEAPELIKETTNGFQISQDIQAISRIQDTIRATALLRKKKLDASRDVLRSLSRSFELSKSTAESSRNSQARAEHPTIMLSLDREKFGLAKNLNELESSVHVMESTLSRLKEELEQLDTEDVTSAVGSMSMQDPTLLRLKVYRMMNIDLAEDDTGKISKLIVRSVGKESDVHVVNVENKYSPYFYANYLWDLLQREIN